MKCHFIHLVAFIFLASTVFAQLDDASLRTYIAKRIFTLHRVTVDPSQNSLNKLLDIEARLGTASRIKLNHGLDLDYRQHSLNSLLDIESRVGTARRLQAYSVTVDYSSLNLRQLMDIEARVTTAARIKQAFGAVVDWKQESLSSLLARETSLSQARYGAALTPPVVTPSVPVVPFQPFVSPAPVAAVPSINPSSYTGRDVSVQRRAGGGYNIYNWTTNDDISLRPSYGGGYSGYNWKNGDEYTIRPRSDDRWNAYNWTTGEEYDIRIRPGGRSAEIYNWSTGKYIDVDH
jgi:hypothetical protein